MERRRVIPPWLRHGFEAGVDRGAPVRGNPGRLQAEPARAAPGAAAGDRRIADPRPGAARPGRPGGRPARSSWPRRGRRPSSAPSPAFLVAADLSWPSRSSPASRSPSTALARSLPARAWSRRCWRSRWRSLAIVDRASSHPQHGFGRSAGLRRPCWQVRSWRLIAGAGRPVLGLRPQAGSRLRLAAAASSPDRRSDAPRDRRSRSEFVTTLTDERAIAPAASAGLSVMPEDRDRARPSPPG